MDRKAPPRLKVFTLDEWQPHRIKVGRHGIDAVYDKSVVPVRVAPSFASAMPIDIDEANAEDAPTGAPRSITRVPSEK